MKHVATAMTLLALVAVAGCGGDDDDGDVASTTPAVGGSGPFTKAQYIAASDNVCKATADKIGAAAATLRASAEKTGELPVRKVTAFLTNTSLPAYNAMLGDLRALTPPNEDEKTVDGFIAALAGAIDTAKSDPVKYSRNGAPDPFDDFNKRVTDYGMTVCGL